MRKPELRYTVTRAHKVIFSKDCDRPFTLWPPDYQPDSLSWFDRYRYGIPRSLSPGASANATPIPSAQPKDWADSNVQALLRSPYRLSRHETENMQVIVEELLGRGFIRSSTSSWAATVLFAPKIDVKLRFCMDFHVLNKQMIWSFFPIPRAEDLIDKTQVSKIFSIIDLWYLYHQFRISEPDITKTAVKNPFGHLEYLVVHFGLTNAPATIQSLCLDTSALYLFTLMTS